MLFASPVSMQIPWPQIRISGRGPQENSYLLKFFILFFGVMYTLQKSKMYGRMCSKEFPSSPYFSAPSFPVSEMYIVTLFSDIFFQISFRTCVYSSPHTYCTNRSILYSWFLYRVFFYVPIYLRIHSVMIYQEHPHMPHSCVDSHAWMCHI